MSDSQTSFPIGLPVSLLGHFNVPVVLEAARPLGKGFECRVRLPDGTLDEAVLSEQEAAALAGSAPASESKTPLVSAEKPPPDPLTPRNSFRPTNASFAPTRTSSKSAMANASNACCSTGRLRRARPMRSCSSLQAGVGGRGSQRVRRRCGQNQSEGFPHRDRARKGHLQRV